MKIDSKKILTIGAGAVVGYLIFCKFMKRAGAKSLEEGAPSEEGMGGGGGGIFGGGGGSVPLPPVANPPYFLQQNITPPQGYVVVGQGGLLAPTSGLDPNKPSQSVVPISNVSTQRETPTPTPPPSTTTTQSALARPSVISATKFTDFDGTQNFQDALL
jgi:hypothetical protein